MQPLYDEGQRLQLKPSQLIKSGGEGMVFALDEQWAAKVYHRPDALRAEKLRVFQDRFAGNLPATVCAPQRLLTNKAGTIVGFVMPRLPAGSLPLKKLSSPPAAHKNGLTLRHVSRLFQKLHQTLTDLHDRGLVVGDLNDHNIHIIVEKDSQPPAGYWLDVDSFQFGPYPCPVALETTLDPHLYHVRDFSGQPYFSPLTDWYAFFVLLLKSLLFVHPYGGMHHQHQSLVARAQAQVTVLDPQVTYPPNARPVLVLSDAIMDHLENTFGQGRRTPFPRYLLDDYLDRLVDCPHCNLAYPHERSQCPGCAHQKSPVRVNAQQMGRLSVLLEVSGEIAYVAVEPSGRLIIVVREGENYSLAWAGVGGEYKRQPLFSGRDGYCFALFSHLLVVNPPGQTALLVLDISGVKPQQVTMLETDTFLGAAVFGATPQAMYRLAQGSILRGIVRQGLFLEEVVATGRPQQTMLWPGREADVLGGCYRVFADLHFFYRSARGHLNDLALPPLPVGVSVREWVVLPGRNAVTVLMQTVQQGQVTVQVYRFNSLGGLTNQDVWLGEVVNLEGAVMVGEAIWLATDQGLMRQAGHLCARLTETAGLVHAGNVLLEHPAGVLVQQSQRLLLHRR